MTGGNGYHHSMVSPIQQRSKLTAPERRLPYITLTPSPVLLPDLLLLSQLYPKLWSEFANLPKAVQIPSRKQRGEGVRVNP